MAIMAKVNECQANLIKRSTESNEDLALIKNEMNPKRTSLSAADLGQERLWPGDTIEYYSMAFGFGDPRGHCITKVLGIVSTDAFPLRLDSQELLQATQMVKRTLDRRGEQIESTVWRKIRTFDLVDGKVNGKTRADALELSMKSVFKDSMKKARQLKAAKFTDTKNIRVISSYFRNVTPSSICSKPNVIKPTSNCTKSTSQLTLKFPFKRPRIDLSLPSALSSHQHDKSSSNTQKRQICDQRSHEDQQIRPMKKVSVQNYVDHVEEGKRGSSSTFHNYTKTSQEVKEIPADKKRESISRMSFCFESNDTQSKWHEDRNEFREMATKKRKSKPNQTLEGWKKSSAVLLQKPTFQGRDVKHVNKSDANVNITKLRKLDFVIQASDHETKQSNSLDQWILKR